MEITLTKDNFEQEVIKSDKPVIVDFWATWCGPCRMLAPVLEDFANKHEGEIKVGKINVDEEPELAERYGIEVIPSLFVFDKGEIKDKSIGLISLEDIEKLVK